MKDLVKTAGNNRLLKKILLTMKLTTVFLMFCLVSVSASTYSQNTRLDIKLTDGTMVDLIQQIEKNSEFFFYYQKEELKELDEITLEANNATIMDILDNALEGTTFDYRVLDRYIVVRKKGGSFGDEMLSSVRAAALAEQQAVSGRVTDAGGQPLPGVTVMVKGTTHGTVTNADGNYSLTNISEGVTLVFSFVGMRTQEVIVESQTNINVTMVIDAIGIEEVVAIGYGTQKRGNLTGSVASIKSDKMTIAPVANTSNALIGQLPGLTALQISGMPGNDASVLRIRGFGTALVIVDGIEGNLNNLDPSQIESISILKDGAASIYGARAGNGVILVTTKRGIYQKPTLTVNSSYTAQGVTRILHPASSGQIAEMEREEHIQKGGEPTTAPWTQEAIDKFYAGNDPGYPNTDWYNHVFRDWAPQQNHNLSIQGGSDKIRYFGYFGYVKQETMIKNNGGDFRRYNVQSNLDADITDRLKMSIDLSMTFQKNNFPIRGMNNRGAYWQDYYRTRPWYPATLPDPTRIPWGGLDVGSIATVSNIDLMGYTRSNDKIMRGIVTFTYDFKTIKGLQAKANMNYTTSDVYLKRFNRPIKFYTYNPNTDVYNVAASFNESRLFESINRSSVLTNQFSLNYNNIFSEKHRVTALGLFEAIDYRSNFFDASRVGLLTPAIDQLFIGSTTGMGNNGSANEMGRKSFVGRINYNFNDRYLVETIFRADASARFPENTRWGYFPSISLGWVITGEEFMQEVTAWDNLKLRASIGQSGNDAVGNFQYLSGYTTRGSYLFEEGQLPGMFITGLANPLLTWETMTLYNGGLDFSIFNQNLYGTVDAFYRKRDGIPATRITSLPSTFGSAMPPENLNELDDRGFEFTLSTKGGSGNFSYDLSGNISWSRSKWVYFEEPEYENADQERIFKRTGNWTDRVMGYVSDGLFTSQQEIDALPYTYTALGGNSSLRPGDVKFKDLNNDGILDWKDQDEIGQGTFPNWIYGFSTLFQYRNITLTTLFQGAFGFSTYVNLTNYQNEVMYDLRWTEKNNDAGALVPRLGGSSSNGFYSDYWLNSVSYLRLKTASLSYELPSSFLSKLHIETTRIYIAGMNLYTISSLDKYRIDPEVESGTLMVYPQQRTVSLGINMSF